MSTVLIWKSLDNYSSAYKLLWKFPIEWDSINNVFLHVKNHRDLFYWYLVLTVNVFICIFASYSIRILKEFFSLQMTISFLTFSVYGMATLFSAFSLICGLACLLYSEEAVNGFNQLQLVETKLQKLSEGQEPVGTNRWNVDAVGVFLNGVVLLCIIFPFCLTAVVVYLNLDPLCDVVTNYGSSHLPSILPVSVQHILMLLIRSGVMVIGALEISRLFPLIIICLCIGIQLVQKCVNMLEMQCNRMSNFRLCDQFISIFCEINIIFKLAFNVLSHVVFILMGTGIFLSVTFNFSTIKMYHLLPVPIYFFSVVMSIVIPLTVSLLLPQGIQIYENSCLLLRKWNKNAFRMRNRKYYHLKMNSLTPLHIYAGIFNHTLYEVKSSTKATYYSVTIYYTITFLLAIDPSQYAAFKSI